jgi:hypothetical protein
LLSVVAEVREALDAPITDLMHTADADDGAAANELFAALYRELHAIAERELRRAGPI